MIVVVVVVLIVVVVLRHQMLPAIFLNSGACQVEIGKRSLGALTGTRVAGLLGRVPVESTIKQRHQAWQEHGYQVEGSTLRVCTYVDNIFAAGRSLQGAITILDDFAEHLKEDWHLDIKASSRSCMVPRGSTEVPADAGRWPLVTEFVALGHVLQRSGATHACRRKTLQAMWRAYFGNCQAPSAKQLPVSLRIRLLNCSVLPVLRHRCSRWPGNLATYKDIGAAQRKMLAAIVRVPQEPDEPVADYVRRRHKAVGALIGKDVAWDQDYCKRLIAWDSHCRRERNRRSWASKLVSYNAADYLEARRALAYRGTGTRALGGFPATRWHEGVAFAQAAKR